VDVTNAGYGIRTERSREIVERLECSIPGGNTRSLTYFPPYPLAISSGSGCRIWDADGNKFIDLLNNYTASVHGHALPAINEAMSEQAALGTVFPAPSELQAELAERIVGLGQDTDGVAKDTEIVPALIDLTHALGLKAVAEGVETAEQLAQVRHIGCDFAQGNDFSEPLPSEEPSIPLYKALTNQSGVRKTSRTSGIRSQFTGCSRFLWSSR
jgi:EAL domain-containing protein/aminotransferase class III